MGVSVERRGAAAVVVMDYPERRNAINPVNAREIADALTAAAAPTDVCGVVLTGVGAFSSGGDLRGAVDRSSMTPEERRRVIYGASQGLLRAIVDVPVPTFAAVDGAAIGMGLDMALACDATLVGPEGWVRQGWGTVGLVSATAGVLFVRRRNPQALWRLLAAQGDLDADACERLRLGEAVSGERALDAALRRVEQLAPMSRSALEGYVELHRAELRRELEPHFEMALAKQLELLASPEFRARVERALT